MAKPLLSDSEYFGSLELLGTEYCNVLVAMQADSAPPNITSETHKYV
jgi:hypothetical protein